MTMKKVRRTLGAALGLSVAVATSCADDGTLQQSSGTGPGGGPSATTATTTDGSGGGPLSWNEGGAAANCEVDELLPAPMAGSKVKGLLTGLPIDDAEYQSLAADPDALRDRIEEWIDLPESDLIMRRFFMTALQQDGTTRENLTNMLGRNDATMGRFRATQLPADYPSNFGPRMDELFRRNMAESMARTAVEFIKTDRPLTDLVTTKSFMMTSALMVLLAHVDDNVVADNKQQTVRTSTGHFDTIRLVREEAMAPPASEALDPNHANFAKFYHPNLRNINLTACGLTEVPDEITVQFQSPNVNGQWRVSSSNHSFNAFIAAVMGRVERFVMHNTPGCDIPASTNSIVLLDYDDFSDWRMVDVTLPSTEGATLFYDLDTIRNASSIALHTPRVGFLSHLGFLGTWMTNEDNGARVTANQALIVGLGHTFESAAIAGYDPPNVDQEHAGDADCYGCHQSLDPIRDLVRGSFTNYYGHQLDGARQDMSTEFYFGGEYATGSGIEFLANQIAAHPMLPKAWVQRFCYFANAQACPEGEELDRVVDAFVASNLNIRSLIVELFSSPLVSGTSCLPGNAAGTTATIARRTTFCANISRRTGVDDICGQDTDPEAHVGLQTTFQDALQSVPDDAYSRDEVKPVTIAETGMFVRANREAACNALAYQSYPIMFDGFENPPTAMQREAGVDYLVQEIMGLPPSDPRYAGAKQIINAHVDEVALHIPEGGTAPLGELIGMMSAVSIACMAPTVAGVGF